jgi:hypothetical protein
LARQYGFVSSVLLAVATDGHADAEDLSALSDWSRFLAHDREECGELEPVFRATWRDIA